MKRQKVLGKEGTPRDPTSVERGVYNLLEKDHINAETIDDN